MPAIRHTNKVAQEYDARLDSRKRLTVRGAGHEYYHVTELESGEIVLSPRELTRPVTGATLEMLTGSMENFLEGEVGEEIDPADIAR